MNLTNFFCVADQKLSQPEQSLVLSCAYRRTVGVLLHVKTLGELAGSGFSVEGATDEVLQGLDLCRTWTLPIFSHQRGKIRHSGMLLLTWWWMRFGVMESVCGSPTGWGKAVRHGGREAENKTHWSGAWLYSTHFIFLSSKRPAKFFANTYGSNTVTTIPFKSNTWRSFLLVVPQRN